MPKMKTSSSAKKRFKVTGKGKIKFKQAKTRHMMTHKSKKMKRKARGTDVMCESDARIILDNFLPYQRATRRRARKKAAVAKKGEAA